MSDDSLAGELVEAIESAIRGDVADAESVKEAFRQSGEVDDDE